MCDEPTVFTGLMSSNLATQLMVAPMLCASRGTFNVAAFTEELAQIERHMHSDDQLTDGEIWEDVQDLYWRGHESQIVHPFLGSYTLPTLLSIPTREQIRGVLSDLTSRMTPGPINRTDPIAQNAFSWGQRVAVRQGTEGLTYGTLDAHADILGRFIAGCRDSDDQQVAIFFSRNRVEHFSINIGAKRAGVAYTNFHSYLSRDQIMEKLRAQPYRVLFLDHESLLHIELYLPLLEAMGTIVVDIDNKYPNVLHYRSIIKEFKRPPAASADMVAPEYPGPVMMSSGTTGEPKLVRVKRDANVGRKANRLFQITERDKNLVVGQLYHGGAHSWAKGHLNRGAMVMLDETPSLAFDPEATLDLIDNHQLTNFWTSPHWLKSLCMFVADSHHDYKLDSLRAIYVGAAPFHPSLKELAVGVFGPIIWENYATTEFGLVTVLRPDQLLAHKETVGRPAPGVEIQIRDQGGTILGPGQVGTIYVKNALTDGRFREGDDFGKLDEDGFLTVLGRSIEKIVTNGQAVFPRTIENHMRGMSGIQDCHVVGIPDKKLGEMVVAAVVLARGARYTEVELLRHMENVAGPGVKGLAPARIVFLRSVPRAPYKAHNAILREVVIKALDRLDNIVTE